MGCVETSFVLLESCLKRLRAAWLFLSFGMRKKEKRNWVWEWEGEEGNLGYRKMHAYPDIRTSRQSACPQKEVSKLRHIHTVEKNLTIIKNEVVSVF